MATRLTMTATVKAIDSQRWVWRTHLFQFNSTSLSRPARVLSRLGRPAGCFDTELLGVLRVQPLPVELQCLGANDASNGLAREAPLKHVEADVPARGSPSDEAAVDAVPQR